MNKLILAVAIVVSLFAMPAPAAARSLTAQKAQKIARKLIGEWTDSVRKATSEAYQSKKMTIDGHTMPLAWSVDSTKGAHKMPLYISLHGGGGAPAELNDQQWRNQQVIYKTDGVYLCPRAPFNTWDLHFHPESDTFYRRIIAMMVAWLDVDPNRVYLMGYSAGGDGVWRLAPRMADTWAAASMMAGHPGDVRLENLYNLPFMIWCGGNDAAYDRNNQCRQRIAQMDSLHRVHPDGYRFEGHIIEGKGHWMDRVDTAAVSWMAQYERNPFPSVIVWRQSDVQKPYFYWISVPTDELARDKELRLHASGNTIDIDHSDYSQITLWLSDQLFDLDSPITVRHRGRTLFQGRVRRSAATLRHTLFQRNDPSYMCPAQLTLQLAK